MDCAKLRHCLNFAKVDEFRAASVDVSNGAVCQIRQSTLEKEEHSLPVCLFVCEGFYDLEAALNKFYAPDSPGMVRISLKKRILGRKTCGFNNDPLSAKDDRPQKKKPMEKKNAKKREGIRFDDANPKICPGPAVRSFTRKDVREFLRKREFNERLLKILFLLHTVCVLIGRKL
uniref:Uncharacterized protein n=1 Tax=Romanomermis culicivorax TaxID=13658 RepID=A0A915KSR8_ROMCU